MRLRFNRANALTQRHLRKRSVIQRGVSWHMDRYASLSTLRIICWSDTPPIVGFLKSPIRIRLTATEGCSSEIGRRSLRSFSSRAFGNHASHRDDGDDEDPDSDAFEDSRGIRVGAGIRSLVRNRRSASTADKPLTRQQVLEAEHRKALENIRALTSELGEHAKRKRAEEQEEKRRQEAVSQAFQKWEADLRSKSSELAALCSTFLDVKYKRITDEIKQASWLYYSARQKYFILGSLFIQDKMRALSNKFDRLVTQIDAFSQPRAHARKRIDKILSDEIDMQGRYVFRLQAPFRAQRDGARDLADIFNELRPLRRDISASLANRNLIRSSLAIGTLGHEFRYWHRLRQNSEGPFAAAWYLQMISYLGNLYYASQLSKTWRMSVNALLAHSSTKYSTPKKSTTTLYEEILTRFLKPRLNPHLSHRNPRLDIFWRQLDVLAPFDLYMYKMRELKNLLRLRKRKYPRPRLTKTSFEAFEKELLALDNSTQRLSSELSAYILINWLRLESETRLDNLGLTAMTIARGLFIVRRPLSQDPRFFNDWLNKVVEARIMATYNKLRVDCQGSAESQRLAKYREEKFYTNWVQPRLPRRRRVFAIQSAKSTLTRRSRTASKADSHVKKSSDRRHEKSKMKRKGRITVNRKSAVKGDSLAPQHPLRRQNPLQPSLPSYFRIPIKGQPINKRSIHTDSSDSIRPINHHQARHRTRSVRPTSPMISSIISEADPAAESSATLNSSSTEKSHDDLADTSRFWTYDIDLQRNASNKHITVHYCRSFETSERIASSFLTSEVVGFDIEWKAQTLSKSIQHNVSLIQLANEDRIALFHTALFRPGRTIEDFVSPSLKRVLECPDILKVGVSIKADCTRVRKYLGIEAKGIFELSYLHKLVKYAQTEPKLINKRAVNLSLQVEEHLGLPLNKDDEIRQSDWTRALNYEQVRYAANDPYACFRLFHVLEDKRKQLVPVPPRPACAELNLPILLGTGEAICERDQEDVKAENMN